MKSFSSAKEYGLANTSNSRCLDGAMSTELEIMYLTSNKRGFEGMPDHGYINRFVPSTFINDYKNDIFIGEQGAIANAYNLRYFSDEEKEEVIKSILEQEKQEHPDYDYTITEGKFPINVYGDTVYSTKCDATVEMSTHILYITDYEKHLKLISKNKSRKR